MDKLLTAAQVAEILGVPIATLYAWRYKRCGPPSVKVGKHLRYRSRDVEEWLSGRVQEGDVEHATHGQVV